MLLNYQAESTSLIPDHIPQMVTTSQGMKPKECPSELSPQRLQQYLAHTGQLPYICGINEVAGDVPAQQTAPVSPLPGEK